MTWESLLVISPLAAAGMALAALGMALTPGPNMVYLASRGISQGRGARMVSLAGTGVGFLVYLVVANLGLGIVFVTVPWLYVGLKAAGVAYLAYLACLALRPGGRGVFDSAHFTRTPGSDCSGSAWSPTCSTRRPPSCTSP